MPSPRANDLLIAAAPGLFVALWSTGFIGARLGLPYAEPLTFLAMRFAAVIPIALILILLARAPRPSLSDCRHEAVTGVLLHSGYLGGMFSSIDAGLPAALAALIGGLQPLLTGVAVGPILGERVSPRQWLGLGLGLAGVVLVLSDKLAPAAGGALFGGFGPEAVGFALIGLCAITAATLYQKRHGGRLDWRWASAVQYAAAVAVTVGLALAIETNRVAWTGEFVFALVWLVVVLSIGAVGLLMLLIRRGAASRVASLFYLVPPCTAVVAWFLFEETFGPVALAGMAVAVSGVALVVGERRG
jgi:drug/metabolite transporter (DMT)-like permease